MTALVEDGLGDCWKIFIPFYHSDENIFITKDASHHYRYIRFFVSSQYSMAKLASTGSANGFRRTLSLSKGTFTIFY
jgi:hypothetical protein